MKASIRKLGHLFVVVIHDKKVERAAWQLAVLIGIRLLVAAGASAEVVGIIKRLAV